MVGWWNKEALTWQRGNNKAKKERTLIKSRSSTREKIDAWSIIAYIASKDWYAITRNLFMVNNGLVEIYWYWTANTELGLFAAEVMRKRTRKFQFTSWTPRSINSTVNQYVHRCVNGLFLMFDTHLINLSAEKDSKKMNYWWRNWFENWIYKWLLIQWVWNVRRWIKNKSRVFKISHNLKRWFNKLLQVIYRDHHEVTFKSMKCFTCWPMMVSCFPFYNVCKPHFRLASLFVKWFNSTAKMFT